MLTFNVQDGFTEALVRGYRSGFLKDVDYFNLCECTKLDDVRMNLSETDYGRFLEDETDALVPDIIRTKCRDKLVKEFEYIRCHASPKLKKFLDFITYEHMIDNVLLLLKATKGDTHQSLEDLIAQCHPLGMFDPRGRLMKTITMFDNSQEGYEALYRDVLSDTPIGKYFEQLLWEFQPPSEAADDTDPNRAARQMLSETPHTVLEHHLHKYYLEDFLAYCEELGGDTALVMSNLLKSRADMTAINVILNSFYGPAAREFNAPNTKGDRAMLMPSIGHLYPASIDPKIGLIEVRNEEELLKKLASAEEGLVGEHRSYHADLNKVFGPAATGQSLDDVFFEREVMFNEAAFEGQMHYGVFYAFVRLKEQEIRNIAWICQCIQLNARKSAQEHFVPIFSKNSPWRKAALDAAM